MRYPVGNRLRTKAAFCLRRTESSSTPEVLYSENTVLKKYERKKKLFEHFILTVKENPTLWKSGNE